MSLKVLLRISILSALATVLMRFINFPVPFFPPFLKYDPGDIPVLIGGLTMGPVAGIAIEAIKNLLAMLLSGTVNLVGALANFTVGGILVLVASMLYRPGQGMVRALLASVTGVVVATAIMIPANVYLFLPPHGVSGAKALAMSLSFLPFNLVKAGITVVATMAVMLRLEPAIRPVAREQG